MMSAKTFLWIFAKDGIGILTMDVPGESMNTLKASFAGRDPAPLLAEVKGNGDLIGLVIVSGKKDSLRCRGRHRHAGSLHQRQDAEALSRAGRDVFAEIETLGIPVIAAIHGPCCVGGLELALACRARVVTDHGKTVLGLPEVQLGLLPGSGGTQRLPRLIGVAKGTGSDADRQAGAGKQARKLGLVDDMVPPSILLGGRHPKLAKKGKPRHHSETGSAGQGAGDQQIWSQGAVRSGPQGVKAKDRGNYPAPERIIEVVRIGVEERMQAGLLAEARHFGELVMTPGIRRLRSLFFATTG